MPQQPIAIQVVTRPGCAHCARTKQTIAEAVTAVAAEYPLVLTEVDLTEHPELLEQHDIWATPALIIDGELAFVGTVSDQRLREKLAVLAAGR